jgi:hypothetical protein
MASLLEKKIAGAKKNA